MLSFAAPSSEDRTAIEKLCRRVFSNNPDTAYYSQHKELLFFITDLYLPFCNSENGDYSQLLVEGGIMEQPYISCKILDRIKLNYKNHISEVREQKEKELKANQKRGRR